MKGIFPVRGHRTNHNIVVCSPGTVVVRSHVVDLVTIRQGGCVVPGGSFLMCGSTNGERVQRGARRMHGLVTQGLRSPALGRSLPRFHIATKQRCVLPGIIWFPSHKQLSQYRHSTYTNNNNNNNNHTRTSQPPTQPSHLQQQCPQQTTKPTASSTLPKPKTTFPNNSTCPTPNTPAHPIKGEQCSPIPLHPSSLSVPH